MVSPRAVCRRSNIYGPIFRIRLLWFHVRPLSALLPAVKRAFAELWDSARHSIPWEPPHPKRARAVLGS